MRISADLQRNLEEAWISIAIGRLPWPPEVKPLPPRLWEAARLELQARLRKATGEPTLVLSYEIPTGDRP